MAKIDDFGGPDHLAWTPLKSGITIKMSEMVIKFGWNQKMALSRWKKFDFIVDIELQDKNGQTWPNFLFVYYNSSDHLEIFLSIFMVNKFRP